MTTNKPISYAVYTIFLFISMFFTSITWGDTSVNLYVGQVKPIQIGKVARVAVGKDSLLQTIILDDGKVLFIPTAAGETDVKIWLQDGNYVGYKFTILIENMGSKKVIAQSLLRAFPRLRVTAIDKHIIVEGKISSVDQEVYKSVIGKIKDVISLVNPNKYNEYQARQLLKSFNVAGIQIKKTGQRLVVSGEVDPQDMPALGVVISKIPNISSLIRPKKFIHEKMVRLKVHVIEMDANFGRQLGISWAGVAKGPSFGLALPIKTNNGTPLTGGVITNESQSNPSAFLGLETSILSQLNFLESRGRARTLSRPTLLARSGAIANFNVGGELPIVFTGKDGGKEIVFKPYGVNVSMEPLVNRNNEIVLKLDTEVSSVDTTVSVLGVPGLKTSKASTTINAHHGRTVAIAGLLQVTSGNDTAQIPYLGDIPLIGKLFKTKGRTFSRRELVFLITPELVTNRTANNAPKYFRNEARRLEALGSPANKGRRHTKLDILE